MLQLEIEGDTLFDEDKQEFIEFKTTTLALEHSLVSISKWESKWNVPFMSDKPMTVEQTIDYIKCMTINKNVDPNVYFGLSDKHIDKVTEYIKAPMTATTVFEEKGKGSSEIITSELIYYWMITFNIPFECQKWHLNRLLMLIKVCGVKNQPAKKMSPAALRDRNRALNASRRKQFNSKG